jgi:hypothetical protein
MDWLCLNRARTDCTVGKNVGGGVGGSPMDLGCSNGDRRGHAGPALQVTQSSLLVEVTYSHYGSF